MPYALENALYQWHDGERRVREARGLESRVERVMEELRRRLGGPFTVAELAGLYGSGTDWAEELAGLDQPAAVVDAAFARYAREARDYAGGVTRPRNPRPDE